MAHAQPFDVQIDAWITRAKDLANAFCLEFVQDIAQAVIEATPVKTGFLRASWHTSIGAPGDSGAAVANVGMAGFTPGDALYLMNGAVYAMRVEYGFVGIDSLGRHYNQAPRAFVRGTLARADEIAEAALARVLAAKP